MYGHNQSHAHSLYIYTPRFYSRCHFVNRGAQMIQRESDSNQNYIWTPTSLGCTKCNCCSNHCEHRRFEFHENDENTQCPSYAHRRHICACPKVYDMCISFPSEALKQTFEIHASESYKTMEYWIWHLLRLRKCTSSGRITLCSDFCENACFSECAV